MAESDQPSIYLHGDLDLHIVEARDLPNMDLAASRIRGCLAYCDACGNPTATTGSKSRRNAKDQKIHHRRHAITSDPYVTVMIPQTTLARTRVIHNSRNPHWNQRFCIFLAHPLSQMEFHVKDDDIFGADLIGVTKIPAKRILEEKVISGWFQLILVGKRSKRNPEIFLDMKFSPCTENSLYEQGIMGDPDQLGTRHTYFPLRKGSKVTLYQDAHVCDDILPIIQLDGGNMRKQEKCWQDICQAISEAHHMIYIVGWSVFCKIKLIREPTQPLPRGGDLSLGELLKYKSEEGVRVLLLVWDDKSSHDKFGINMTGVMQTHDEETRKFFKHSSVTCVLSPRYASNKLGYIKQQVVGTIFTHHQKCVLVDTQAFGNNRKITAFLGGLDLCDGRYDTPEHRLFRDINTVFKEDFHNPICPTGVRAPREPWHDMHCRIDGPAAYDVLLNFEQRWLKARKRKNMLRFKKSHWHDDALLKIERISWILSPKVAPKDSDTAVPPDQPAVHVSSEDDPGNWHVQIFRSIDSGSVKGFPKNVAGCEAQNLVCAKNLVVDKSIQVAYIQAIRSAQHFIYIENQYFLGSSYAWPSYKNAGADNLIPMELALKIVSKIRARERFAVYVVIPMWPEGDPKSAVVQEILYWQSQTMQMMFNIVSMEIKALGHSDVHPQDYLNFYCLGNREKNIQESSNNNADMAWDPCKFQRFMIYVHAKGMIVDDEYIILGSANINQRSMAGTKDTEIAMGAYQPHHTRLTKSQPRGQVYGYRMSLWAEHLGINPEEDDIWKMPQSLECVKRVNNIGEENWKRYTNSSFTSLQGHLLKYPLSVDTDGNVSSLPGHETFPDVGGKVLGAHSVQLIDTLTT